MPKMDYGAMHGRVTICMNDPMFAPTKCFQLRSRLPRISDQVVSTPPAVRQHTVRRTHNTHKIFFVSHHMYTNVKHLSASLINVDIELLQHATFPLAVEEKLRLVSAACFSRLLQPHLTQRLQQHIFPTARFSRCGACRAKLGPAWHGTTYTTFCRRRILRALFVPFHLRSRRQPALWSTSAINQVQLPSRARDRRIMLQYSNLAGADTKGKGGKMI